MCFTRVWHALGMGWILANAREWLFGVCCVFAAAVSGYALFASGQTGGGIWLHVVFLMAIFLTTVAVVRLLARRAIASMHRGVERRR